MGLVACPKHGNGFMFVCPHVGEAVVAGRACQGIEFFGCTDADPELSGFGLDCWFCPQCFSDHELPPNGTVIADDDFMNRTASLYCPMCPGCFKDWSKTGTSTIASGSATAATTRWRNWIYSTRIATARSMPNPLLKITSRVLQGALAKA